VSEPSGTALQLCAESTNAPASQRLRQRNDARPGGAFFTVGGDNAVSTFLADDDALAANTCVDRSVESGEGAGKLDSFKTAINGTGSKLVLTRTTNMPFEAAAFDNIRITGLPGAGRRGAARAPRRVPPTTLTRQSTRPCPASPTWRPGGFHRRGKQHEFSWRALLVTLHPMAPRRVQGAPHSSHKGVTQCV
jgi:hypothetical protein